MSKANLSGKVALITGGVRGIGRATAEVLLSKCVKVCIADIDATEGETALAELQAQFHKDNIIFKKLDVSNKQEFEDVVKTTKSHFGHLDILINNAGIVNEINWQKCLDINLTAVAQGIFLAHQYLEGKDHQKGGVVINTASVAGLVPQLWFCAPTYCATKCGVVGLTKSWGHELNVQQTKVKVNAVCPDLTNTALLTTRVVSDFQNEIGEKVISEVGENIYDPLVIGNAIAKLLEDDVTGALLVVSHSKGVYYFDHPEIV